MNLRRAAIAGGTIVEVGFRLISLLIGYCFGLFQTAIVIGKVQGFDIRKVGSGNAGTTNMLRTRGFYNALLTFLGDFLKSVIAMLIAEAVFRKTAPDMIPLLKMYAGFGAVLGHDFPFYSRFKGGKGVATTAGVAFSICPWTLPLLVACFFAIFFPTHLVSVCSLVSYAFFFVQILVLGKTGYFGMTGNYVAEIYVLALILTGLCFWQHRANIGRLMRGEENKVYLHKKYNDAAAKKKTGKQ